MRRTLSPRPCARCGTRPRSSWSTAARRTRPARWRRPRAPPCSPRPPGVGASSTRGPGWAPALRHLGADAVGGAFRFAIDSSRIGYRVVEAGVALRCRLWRLSYGDQGLFVRRGVYGMIGGFPPLPLMEDVVFVRRLSRVGVLAFPTVRALTSARRWE